jgi:hypothetical protein
MALLRRDLCRQIKGPEVTHAACCTLIFDTDAKTLYVEREVAHVDVHDGSQTTTMDICDYLKQGGQAAGHASYGGCCEPFSKRTSIQTRWYQIDFLSPWLKRGQEA